MTKGKVMNPIEKVHPVLMFGEVAGLLLFLAFGWLADRLGLIDLNALEKKWFGEPPLP